eukprot:gene7235-344_t
MASRSLKLILTVGAMLTVATTRLGAEDALVEGPLAPLATALGFSKFQMDLFLQEISTVVSDPSSINGVVKGQCTSGPKCAKQAYMNLHWLLHQHRILPADVTWQRGAAARQYITNFLRNTAVPHLISSNVTGRCLEWDVKPGSYTSNAACQVTDGITYTEQSKQFGTSRAAAGVNSGTQFFGDIHNFSSTFPELVGAYDVVFCTQVFEHLHDPFQAAREIFNIVRPGGKVIVTAPHISPEHGVPYDFFRYTHRGLMTVFEKAGFSVHTIEKEGNVANVVAMFEGMDIHISPLLVTTDKSGDDKGTPYGNYLHLNMIVSKPM